MNFTTIKLDKTTLPEDGQWVEFETYSQIELVGQCIENQEVIASQDNISFSMYDVYEWKPLAIKWQFHEWLERREGLCCVIGYDRFDNEFFANAVMSCGEIEDVSDIEYNGK